MNWIKSFTKSSFVLYAGNTVDAFQPLDFFHFYPLWYDLWIERIVSAMEKLQVEKKNFHKLKDLLPGPSSIKAIIQKIIPSYNFFQVKNPEAVKKTTNFLARMLVEAMPRDPYGDSAAPLHSREQVRIILRDRDWQNADEDSAKKIGKLIVAAGSLVHGLYNDLVTDFGWDAYGPYKIDSGRTLLIRHFPDLRPKELWGEEHLSSAKEIEIYGIYEGIEWIISFIGCHTMIKGGSALHGLKKFAVIADGRPLTTEAIDKLIEELSQKAERIYRLVRVKDFEQLKEMVILQECYQLKKMFEATGMDFRPTTEMFERIKNKPLMQGVVPHGKLMNSMEEYVQSFGIRHFASEVLGEHDW